MPFTVSPSSYRGGELLAAGITGGTNAMGEALQKYAEDKAKVGFADTVLDYAKTVPGAISPEALKRYATANAKEKAYIALGAGSNLKDIFLQQKQEWENREAAAHANYYMQGGARGSGADEFNLTAEEEEDYERTGKVPLRTSRKSFQPADVADTVDMENGQPVYTKDRAMYRSKGQWKPVTEAMRKAIDDYEATAAAQAEADKQQQGQTPGRGGQGAKRFFSNIFGAFGGASPFGEPSPAEPTPTPTPPAREMPSSITAPAAPTPAPRTARRGRGRGGDRIAAAAQIKAAYKAGQLSQEEATRQLQALGFQ